MCFENVSSLFYIYSYEKTCLELCEVFKNAPPPEQIATALYCDHYMYHTRFNFTERCSLSTVCIYWCATVL
jgi:hypothetical protein